MSKQTRSLEFGVQGPMMVGRELNAPYLSKVRVGLSVCPVSYLSLSFPLTLHSSRVSYSKKGRCGAQGELSK